jgi:hypothetical protein
MTVRNQDISQAIFNAVSAVRFGVDQGEWKLVVAVLDPLLKNFILSDVYYF